MLTFLLILSVHQKHRETRRTHRPTNSVTSRWRALCTSTHQWYQMQCKSISIQGYMLYWSIWKGQEQENTQENGHILHCGPQQKSKHRCLYQWEQHGDFSDEKQVGLSELRYSVRYTHRHTLSYRNHFLFLIVLLVDYGIRTLFYLHLKHLRRPFRNYYLFLSFSKDWLVSRRRFKIMRRCFKAL